MSLPGGMIEPPGSFAFSRMDKCMPAETKVCLQRPTGAHRTAPSLSGSRRPVWSVGGRGKVPVMAQKAVCQHLHIRPSNFSIAELSAFGKLIHSSPRNVPKLNYP